MSLWTNQVINSGNLGSIPNKSAQRARLRRINNLKSSVSLIHGFNLQKSKKKLTSRSIHIRSEIKKIIKWFTISFILSCLMVSLTNSKVKQRNKIYMLLAMILIIPIFAAIHIPCISNMAINLLFIY